MVLGCLLLQMAGASSTMVSAGHGAWWVAQSCIRENPDGSFTDRCAGESPDSGTRVIKGGENKKDARKPDQPKKQGDGDRRRGVEEDR